MEPSIFKLITETATDSPIITLLFLIVYMIYNDKSQKKKFSEIKNVKLHERKENIETKERLVKLASYETALYKERKYEIETKAENEQDKVVEGAFDVLRLDIADKFRETLWRKKEEWVCEMTNKACPYINNIKKANLSGYTGELYKAFKDGEKIAKGFIKFNGYMSLPPDKLEDYCVQKNKEINKKIWNALIPVLPQNLIEGHNKERATEEYTLKTFREIIYNVIEIKKQENVNIEKERDRKEKALRKICEAEGNFNSKEV